MATKTSLGYENGKIKSIGANDVLDIAGSIQVAGDLTVAGSTISSQSETVFFADSTLLLNSGDHNSTAVSGGLAILTAVQTSLAYNGYTASTRKVEIDSSAGDLSSGGSAAAAEKFSPGDYICLGGAGTPDSAKLIFEVESSSHDGNTSVVLKASPTAGAAASWLSDAPDADISDADTQLCGRALVSVLHATGGGTFKIGQSIDKDDVSSLDAIALASDIPTNNSALSNGANYVTGAGAVSAVSADDAYLKNDASDTTSGTITAGGFTTTGNWTFDTSDGSTQAIATVQISSEDFNDVDTELMTSAAIQDKILSYGYTTNTGDITGVTAGAGLSGGGASGAVSLVLDLSEFSAVAPASGDAFATLDSNGTTEQLCTVDALASLFAGTNLTATDGVLSVNTDAIANAGAALATADQIHTFVTTQTDAMVAATSGQAGSVANSLTVDNTTVQLSSGTTYNGGAALTISAKTAAIADGGAALATADQIHTFVTTEVAASNSSTQFTSTNGQFLNSVFKVQEDVLQGTPLSIGDFAMELSKADNSLSANDHVLGLAVSAVSSVGNAITTTATDRVATPASAGVLTITAEEGGSGFESGINDNTIIGFDFDHDNDGSVTQYEFVLKTSGSDATDFAQVGGNGAFKCNINVTGKTEAQVIAAFKATFDNDSDFSSHSTALSAHDGVANTKLTVTSNHTGVNGKFKQAGQSGLLNVQAGGLDFDGDGGTDASATAAFIDITVLNADTVNLDNRIIAFTADPNGSSAGGPFNYSITFDGDNSNEPNSFTVSGSDKTATIGVTGFTGNDQADRDEVQDRLKTLLSAEFSGWAVSENSNQELRLTAPDSNSDAYDFSQVDASIAIALSVTLALPGSVCEYNSSIMTGTPSLGQEVYLGADGGLTVTVPTGNVAVYKIGYIVDDINNKLLFSPELVAELES